MTVTFVRMSAPAKWRVIVMRMLRKGFLYTSLLLAAGLILLPLGWIVLTSLKRPSEYLVYPITILPKEPQWQNYVIAVTAFSFPRFLANSIFLAGATGIIHIVVNSMCGFAFARITNVPGSRQLFSLAIALLVMPGVIFTIPQFILYARLGLTNSYWPWFLGALGGSAYHIFLFRQFFYSIPSELEDAAEVDGCSYFRMFWQIFLPNTKPALAVSYIFHFGWVWGDVIGPLLYLREDQMTLAVKLMTAYVDPQGNPLVPVQLAASVFYMAPLIIMFFLAQRYILRGIVTSGLKG